jgi:hypothetical protein
MADSRNREYIRLADGGKIWQICRRQLCGVILAGGSRAKAEVALLLEI